ncbi:cysteine-rich receptor-like protein kinase 10 [Silene latifolia]|uniref:cysteine-rich receptor-like protein kinase 10 n=1 Tax=Silene latifolia TaxID=37657 RepID=UPI003D78B08E
MLKLLATFRACFSLYRKKADEKQKAEVDGLTNAELVRFDFATIKLVTADFSVSNKIGEGKFGVVYKGTLKSGKEIAIKRLSCNIDAEVFMNWFSVVARLQHPNLVKHLGFCSEGNKYMLVSEFMPNANPSKRVQLNWETWYKIILGVAKGLEYLHQDGVLHTGLKTSNVLLDEDMNPKIVDYAISWFCRKSAQLGNACAHSAPEYCSAGEYSNESDVYCFGILILEALSNLRVGESYQSLTDFHQQVLKIREEGRLSQLIKPELSVKCPEADVITCIHIGSLCVARDKTLRPTMTDVILMLTSDLASR